MTSTYASEISPEQEAVETTLVETVVASFDACENPRLREVMVSLVRHLESDALRHRARPERGVRRSWTSRA